MGNVTITITDRGYQPDPAQVTAGDRVRWCNQSSGPHTATAANGSWDTGFIPPGECSDWIDSFQKPGPVPYHCKLHEMTGNIVVEKA